MEDTQYNKTQTVIIGAGGLGREVLSWISMSKEDASKYNIVGFLNDNAEVLNDYQVDIEVVGEINLEALQENQKMIVAISDSKVKEKLFSTSIGKHALFESYHHQTAIIGTRTVIGIGSVISPNVIISCDSKIGNLVFINCGSQIGHDVTIGDYCSIMASVNIGGGAVIGKRVTMGTGSIILPGVKIPDDTFIGAGSVVVKSIKEAGTYFGNPAKKIF